MRAEGGYHFKLEDIECCDKLADLLVDMVIKKNFQNLILYKWYSGVLRVTAFNLVREGTQFRVGHRLARITTLLCL